MKTKLLYDATDNRYKCTCCGGKILKGEKYFRDSMQAWRSSHTINICRKCIARLYLRLSYEETELNELKNETILNRVEGEKNVNEN